jgi:predicted amidohydrolase YtcJ
LTLFLLTSERQFTMRCPIPALLCIALVLVAHAHAQAPRDAVLVNGHIYTANDAKPTATALSILGDRIMEVGTDEEVLTAAAAGTQVLDLAGKTVVPGFIDAHGHLLNLGLSLQQLDVTGTKSYQEIIDAVAARAGQTPAGQWILGRGWDQNDWPEQAFPEHVALSNISPHHPVSLVRVDGHAMLVNAAALVIAGINAQTPDPEGGKILRDATGNPTGVLVDNAMALVRGHVPPPAPEQKREALKLAIATLLRLGVTSVHDAGVDAATLDLYKSMIDNGEFPLRVYAMIAGADVAGVNQYLETGPVVGYGDRRLTVRAIKLMADGALGSRGAALFDPYTDDPGNTGLLILGQEPIQMLTQRALAANFQVCTHAIGDRANRTVLDAYAAAFATAGIDPKANEARLRIEHAQVIAGDDYARFAEMRIIASMQATHATSDMPWAGARLGPDRIAGAYAWQRFIKTGVKIANGSDFPVESPNPLWGFYAAITRQDHAGNPPEGWQPDQRMTRDEALRSFTRDAAFAAFEEADKGTIEPGKLADLAILDRNIMEVPPPEILQTSVVMTFFGGKVAYNLQ